jgi:hypothetical protein
MASCSTKPDPDPDRDGRVTLESAGRSLMTAGFQEVERKQYSSFGNWSATYERGPVQVRVGYERGAFIEAQGLTWNDWFGAYAWAECLAGDEVGQATWPLADQVRRLVGMVDQIDAAIDERGEALRECLTAARRERNLTWRGGYPG